MSVGEHYEIKDRGLVIDAIEGGWVYYAYYRVAEIRESGCVSCYALRKKPVDKFVDELKLCGAKLTVTAA